MPVRGTPPEQVTLTVAPPDSVPLPAPKPGEAQVQVEAPFVFRAADVPPSPPNLEAATLPMSRSGSQAPLLTTAEPPPDAKQHKGVLGKMKGFFSEIVLGTASGVGPPKTSDLGHCDHSSEIRASQSACRVQAGTSAAEAAGTGPMMQR